MAEAPWPACAVGVFARAPVPGATKTRLIPALGAEGAAALAAALLRRALATATQAALGPVTLWAAGDAAHPALRRLADEAGAALAPQCEGDLGARMHAALSAMQAGGRPALVIGADAPALQPLHLQQAAQALQSHDVALLPAEDGGYVLVGRRVHGRALFDGVDWGTGQVMAQTRARCDAAGWRRWEGPLLWDVDRPDDLPRLLALQQQGVDLGPGA